MNLDVSLRDRPRTEARVLLLPVIFEKREGPLLSERQIATDRFHTVSVLHDQPDCLLDFTLFPLLDGIAFASDAQAFRYVATAYHLAMICPPNASCAFLNLASFVLDTNGTIFFYQPSSQMICQKNGFPQVPSNEHLR